MVETIETSFIISIFGASGDLAKIKIFPSLYALAKQNRLPKDYLMVGFARTQMSHDEFKKTVRQAVKKYSKLSVDETILNKMLKHVFYFSGQYSSLEDFVSYRQFLKDTFTSHCGAPLRLQKIPHIAYFSIPPVVFKDVVKNLGESRTNKHEDLRLVIEKPFGDCEKSAKALFHFISQHFHEDQFYLLDHYLGKASVQSILNMRQSNRVLNNIIRGSEIANIQITAAESVGVGHRIGYFEQVGIVKDIIQSHLLQVLALVTMNIPNHRNAASLQREKGNILEAIDCPCDAPNVVLGQYESYKKAKGVAPKSRTETYAAVRLFLDSQQWYNVPIYLRTGKRLSKKHTYAVIELKKFPFQGKDEAPNRIVIEFHPEPRIGISLINFQEGAQRYQTVSTSASIACNIEGCLPEHGELLLDVLKKERMHFLSFNEILASWKIVDRITQNMKEKKIKLNIYKDGSRGPESQHSLPKKDGYTWFDPNEIR
ncbi:MAG: glucose-6-phosphate dehydrogenase (NADP(+)) [Candidatus Magasanikbacteria bacterium]|jgi:glucose-6-phosphate 1-dehydrogenase|nr:glucose-6-phosphate dehydrogenase (NADP(+)) [Candidatus Magasanikbacteria bacterium]